MASTENGKMYSPGPETLKVSDLILYSNDTLDSNSSSGDPASVYRDIYLQSAIDHH